jgi:transcription antitermination protein NusB
MTRTPKSNGAKGGGNTGAGKTGAAKTRVRKTGASKTGGPQDAGHKGAGPKNNGHAAGQVEQAGGNAPAGHAHRKANKRGAARLAAVQAILAQFESYWLGREVEGEQYLPAEAAFFRDIVSGVVDVQRDLDPRIDAALEATWPLKRIEAILRSVLRAGAYELERRTDIPARVVVSEYVDVANAFVDKTETGMVNAVLDRLARNARAEEFG